MECLYAAIRKHTAFMNFQRFHKAIAVTQWEFVCDLILCGLALYIWSLLVRKEKYE